MAIRIVDGIPRSGKTFYAVRHFSQNFCEFIEGDFYLKEGLTVISNIDGLTLPHIKLSDLIRIPSKINEFVKKLFPHLIQEDTTKPTLMEFFSHSYQEHVIFPQYKAVIYILDEAQVYFRKNDRSKEIDEVYHWLELHGHFGQDVYLITQSYKKLPTDINIMPEYIIHSVPRSRSMTGEFRYKQIAEGGEVQRKFGIYPDQKIFDLYKSSSAKETEKISNPMMRQTLQIFIVILLCLSGAGYFLYNRLHPKLIEPIKNNQSSQTIKKPSIPSNKTKPISPMVTPEIYKPVTVLVPVNHISKTTGKQTTVLIFFQGTIIPVADFPFPLVVKGSTLYAKINPSLMYLFKPEIKKPSPVEEELSPAERLERSGAGDESTHLAKQ